MVQLDGGRRPLLEWSSEREPSKEGEKGERPDEHFARNGGGVGPDPTASLPSAFYSRGSQRTVHAALLVRDRRVPVPTQRHGALTSLHPLNLRPRPSSRRPMRREVMQITDSYTKTGGSHGRKTHATEMNGGHIVAFAACSGLNGKAAYLGDWDALPRDHRDRKECWVILA